MLEVNSQSEHLRRHRTVHLGGCGHQFSLVQPTRLKNVSSWRQPLLFTAAPCLKSEMCNIHRDLMCSKS